MDFEELQTKIVENALAYGNKYGIEIDDDFALLKLIEEVGEFTQSVLIHRKKSRPDKHLPESESKKKMAMEIADVIGMAIVNAHVLDIDIVEALKEKWINKETTS